MGSLLGVVKIDGLDERARQGDIFDRPVLAAIERHGAQEGVRRRNAVGYGLDDLLPDQDWSMIIAAAVGTSVPLVLHRFNVDPAIATGPFVTTSVDILGLLFYFWLATITMDVTV